MKRVLVTGARGFIGRHVLPRLLAAGVGEVHATTSGDTRTGALGAEWHRVDLLDSHAAAALVRSVQPTHLLHLAWVTTPGRYWTSNENQRWLEASEKLLLSFVKAKGRRVVVAGSCAEYDWSSTGGVCDEVLTALTPTTPYGRAKNELRLRLQAGAKASGCSWAWGRLFWLYGPGEPAERLVPSVARAALAGDPAYCFQGDRRRDFLYVEDAAQYLIDLLAASDVVGAFNLGSGAAVLIRDVALAVARAAGGEHLVHLTNDDTAPSEPPIVVAAMRRARSCLPLQSPTSIEVGVSKALAWWREEAGCVTAK